MMRALEHASVLALGIALLTACGDATERASEELEVVGKAESELLTAPGNVVANPGFDNAGTVGNLPPPWSGLVKLEASDTGTAHNYQRNGLLTGGTGWMSADQLLPVAARTRYKFGAWVYTSADVNAAMLDVRKQSNNALVGHLQTGPHNAGYRYLSYEFESENESNVWMILGMHSPGPSSWMRLDDVSAIPNRVGNGGFENSTGAAVASPWIADATGSIVTGAASSGNKSARIASSDGAWHALNQWVTVRPNTNYKVKVSLKSSVGLSNIHVDVRGASDYAVIGAASPAASSTWQQISINFNSGSNSSVLVYAGYQVAGSGTFLDVDDFSVFEQDPPSPPAGAFTKHTKATSPNTCTAVCMGELGTSPYSTKAGSCVGGYSDNGLGAQAVGCLQILPAVPTYRDATCYCQPFTKVDQQGTQASTLTYRHTDVYGRFTGSAVNDTRAVSFWGVDHGFPVKTNDGTLFLFSDADETRPSLLRRYLDPVARLPSSTSVSNLSIPQLQWYYEDNVINDAGKVPSLVRSFRPFKIPKIDNSGYHDLGGGAGVRHALAIGQKLYTISLAWTGPEAQSLILSHTTNDASSSAAWNLSQMTTVDEWRTNYFNIPFMMRKNGAPNEVYIYGSPLFAHGPVYLAKVDLSDLLNFTDHTRWKYYAGLDVSGNPAFVRGESNATPLIDDATATEPNVSYHSASGLYLMMSRGGGGLVVRTSPNPVGPWSASQTVYNASGYPGVGLSIHGTDEIPREPPLAPILLPDDGLYEEGPGVYEIEQGGPYGGYLVDSWDATQSGVHSVRFTFSSFRPYHSYIMSAVFTSPGVSAPPQFPTNAGTLLTNRDFAAGLTGWTATGGGSQFVTYSSGGGQRLTTFTSSGDATTGTIEQSFVVGTQNTKMEFTLCGGRDASRDPVTITSQSGYNVRQRTRVKLVDLGSGETVRSTSGRHTCNWFKEVRWDLRPFMGRAMSLQIEDSAASNWGYIDVGPITQLPI